MDVLGGETVQVTLGGLRLNLISKAPDIKLQRTRKSHI